LREGGGQKVVVWWSQGVPITEAALLAASKLSTRYTSERHLPDKAIECLDEAAAQVSFAGRWQGIGCCTGRENMVVWWSQGAASAAVVEG
jgi:hypothetical protein